MRRVLLLSGLSAICLAVVALAARAQVGQPPPGPAAPPRHPSPSTMAQATLDEMLIRFPLPAGQEAYAGIDGRRMHKYVIDQAHMARKYRDQGHPRFWGRALGNFA